MRLFSKQKKIKHLTTFHILTKFNGKMATKQINITDVFEAKMCSLCGSNEMSKFYGINENFIEYCGVYYPYREILYFSLNIQISKEEGETMEICLECKEKLLKFYHFKRKIQEAQECIQKSSNKKPLKTSEKRSKIVHNIYDIIENYAEKCNISKIRVNEKHNQLIIEPSSDDNPRPLKRRITQNNDGYFGEEEDNLVTTIIKHEPLMLESTFINESEDCYPNDSDDSQEITAVIPKIKPPKSKKSKKSATDKPEKPKRHRKEYLKRQKDGEEVIGSIDLSVEDVESVFNADENKFNPGYGDVFRKLFFNKYQTRINVHFSFVGKGKARITVRCEKCRASYKIEGRRDYFAEKIPLQCSIVSTRSDFCRCAHDPVFENFVAMKRDRKEADFSIDQQEGDPQSADANSS